MANKVSFYLNGREVTVENPSPDLLLIDYLRSPGVGLAGPKKPCAQGGCGGCTVILSHWNKAEKKAEHRAINSCLRPVCALGGLVVTTVEGTGAVRRPNPAFLNHAPTFSRGGISPTALHPPVLAEAQEDALAKRKQVQSAVKAAVQADSDWVAKLKLADEPPDYPTSACHAGMNPVAYRLAMNNGSQCGYCSVGFVMNMSEFIVNHPNATKREIEDAFDGNICRCTGYRAILTGMKTFASDWTEEDEKHRMPCKGDAGCEAQRPADVTIPFPDDAQAPPQPVSVDSGHRTWHTPLTLEELARIIEDNRGKKLRMVHGNTSYGIYKEEYLEAEVLVDIRLIPDLHSEPKVIKGELHVGAGISYSDLIDAMEIELKARKLGETSRLWAAQFMARRTAGRIVRNAASLAGNTMLVLRHIASGTGEPFPSDIFTALAAADARIEYLEVLSGKRPHRTESTVEELVEQVAENPKLADSIVLLSYYLPLGEPREVVLAQKVALRDVNAHSIVNVTTRFDFSRDVVESARLVFGGIAPFPWRARKTEKAIVGKKLSLAEASSLAAILETEVHAELKHWEHRMKGLPSEGFTDEYRTQLAVSFLYKAIVNALLHQQPGSVPEDIRSSGKITWGRWAVSDGRQYYKIQDYKKPVSQPYIKLTAMYQTSGQIHYTHELPVPPLTVNGALVQSRRALAMYHFVVPGHKGAVDAAGLRKHLTERFPSFVDLITDEEIKDGGINLQGMGSDQPIFAVDRVSYIGQCIAMVLAHTEQEAISIADYVTRFCVGYTPVKWKGQWPKQWYEPVLSLEKAIEMGSVFPDAPVTAPFVSHIWKIIRPGSRFDWITPHKNPLDRTIVNRPGMVDGLACHIIEGAHQTGSQVHFYMETQACIAEPADGRRIIMRPSTQSPMEMHATTAMALGIEYHRIDVQVPSVGGGFGGKTEQARFVIGAAAVAAYSSKKPVRLVLPREEDSNMIGKRHAYYGQYQIAVDRGEFRPEDKGTIRGYYARMWGDGGAFYDCSFIVSNSLQLRFDGAYRVQNFENQLDVCRTNTAPNTAFRAFGDIQSKNILENALDDAAFVLGMLPEDVREKNLYDQGDVTPFGQALSYCYMKDVWKFLKAKCKFEEKKRSVDEFNQHNRWRKRGIAMLPVKYGSGYNWTQLEQAAAIVAVNQGDGSVLIHQGGVEMGQGLTTQVVQIASYVLNVPMELIYVDDPRTSITPHPPSTGGSIGTSYNGEAVKHTCEKLRERLTEFGYEMLKENGGTWCTAQGIDFWNHGEQGWAAQVVTNGKKTLIWQNLVQQAYSKRVSLIVSYTAKIRGGTVPVPSLTFKKEKDQPNIPGVDRVENATLGGGVDSFTGFTYSAACAVADVDILTGEVKILSADIVYDVGWSLNPAIDIGQVEGAFVQGIGYLLTENLVFEPEGPEKGRLNTNNTWRYKPPAVTTIPLEMNVHLFPRDLAKNIPEDANELFSSKEVGEPPLVLANSVYFAVKAAVRASRLERNLSGLFRMDAPATVQEVRKACQVSVEDLGG
ncbi:MAG TPA: molybdopterin cofactor-binding domain-containing protein [Candidatus Angelobacter sp.]|nr:molybdopterin cofactor-binding domain-containing protein [Candidatus Angelobacter sp.]